MFSFYLFLCQFSLKYVSISSSISHLALLSSILLLHFIVWRFTIIAYVVVDKLYIRVLMAIEIISLYLLIILVEYTFLVKLLQFISIWNKRILKNLFRLFITHHSKISSNWPKVSIKLLYLLRTLSENCSPVLTMIVLYFINVRCALKKTF